MKKFNNILLLFLISFLLFSCSDDNPTNVNNNDNDKDTIVTSSTHFNLQNLTILNFEEYSIDSQEVKVPNTTKMGKLEKIKSENIPSLNNIMGIFFDKKYDNDPKIYSYNYAYDSTKLYLEADIINDIVNFMTPNILDSMFLLPKDYYKIADNNLNSWNAAKITVDKTVESNGTTKNIKGTLNLDMLKTGNLKDYDFQNKKIKVQEYVGTINYNGTSTMTQDLLLNISVDMHFLVNSDYGVVKLWIPYTNINLVGMIFKFNGYVFNLR